MYLFIADIERRFPSLLSLRKAYRNRIIPRNSRRYFSNKRRAIILWQKWRFQMKNPSIRGKGTCGLLAQHRLSYSDSYSESTTSRAPSQSTVCLIRVTKKELQNEKKKTLRPVQPFLFVSFTSLSDTDYRWLIDENGDLSMFFFIWASVLRRSCETRMFLVFQHCTYQCARKSRLRSFSRYLA